MLPVSLTPETRPGISAAAPNSAAEWFGEDRPAVISPCSTVNGAIDIVRPEADGDVHMQLKLGSQMRFRFAKTHAKVSALVEGGHVKVTGSCVQDNDSKHGWREIHPITSVKAD